MSGPAPTPEPSGSAPVELAIEAVLDLHSFKPREIPDLLAEYLAQCRQRGLLEVRVVHGKGIGQLRMTVHRALTRNPGVLRFDLAGEAYGGQGATIVHLKPPP